MSEANPSIPGGVAALLLAAGATSVAVGLLADSVGIGGAPGLGPRQLILVAIGAGAITVGAIACLRPDNAARRLLERLWFSPPAMTSAQCIRTGLWFGLTIGIVEVVHSGLRKHIGGLLLKQPEDIIWMVPLCYTTVCGFFGLALSLVAMRWRVVTVPMVCFPLVLLGSWSQFLMQGWISPTATVFVVLGIAIQLTRTTCQRAGGFARMTKRSLPWLIAIVVACAITLGATRSLSERSLIRDLPAAETDAPNVLLVVLDTVRIDHLSAYGYHRETTPALDQLADRSIVFNWAVASSPWTLPSHSTMFTGRYHGEINADWLVPLDDTHPTLAEELSKLGYATGGFVGNLMYCLRENGIARGFARYDDFLVSAGNMILSTSVGRFLAAGFLGPRIRELATNHADVVTSRFLDWLPTLEGRPFFAFLNYFDAHALYIAPPGYDSMFGKPSPFIDDWYDYSDWSPEQMQGFVNAYDGCIRYIDDQFSRILEHLDANGLRDNTIVIVTADHGELFGEHGLTDHGNSLYRPLIHVPLLISFPEKLGPHRQIDDYVTMRDLPATILDMVGATSQTRIPGDSLARFWDPASTPGSSNAPLLSEVSKGVNTPPGEPRSLGDMKSLFADGIHYIRNGDGSEHIYDMSSDPDEEHDLSGTTRGDELAQKFRALLNDALSTYGK